MSIKRIPLGNISVNFVGAIIRTLEQLGVSSAAILENYHLNQRFLGTPDARISIPKFMRLGNEAIRLSQTPHFGLLMGKNMTAGDMGLPGFAAMTAATLGQSLDTLITYESLLSQNSRGHSSYYMEQGRAVCQFYSVSPYNQFNYFVVDSMLSTWHHFAQWLTQGIELVHHLDIEHDNKQYQSEYEALFDCPVHFGASRNAVILKKGREHYRPVYANRASHQSATQLCAHEKQRLEKGKTTKDQVIELIGAQLAGKPPNIDDIAQKMGIAGWTLRRRLKAEGHQFQVILDQTRRELARAYVRDTHHNFTEIAFLLGFSSPAAFQRAFKRWTNLSPGVYRQSL